jgi:hypothetical protein
MDDFMEDDADDFFASRPSTAEGPPQGGRGAAPKSSGAFLFVDETVEEYASSPRSVSSGVVTFVDDDLDNPNPKFRHSSTPRPSARPPRRRGGWRRLLGSMIGLLLLLAGAYAAYRTFIVRTGESPFASPVVSPAESVSPARGPSPATPMAERHSSPVSVGTSIGAPRPATPAPSPPPAAETRKPVRAVERPQRRKARPQPARSETTAASPAQPVESVACILPSGQEVRMPYSSCRARSGVIYR